LPHDAVVNRADWIDLDGLELRGIAAEGAHGLRHLVGYWNNAEFHAGGAGACHEDTDGQEFKAHGGCSPVRQEFRCAMLAGTGFSLIAMDVVMHRDLKP
jgi:hypothetical protein